MTPGRTNLHLTSNSNIGTKMDKQELRKFGHQIFLPLFLELRAMKSGSMGKLKREERKIGESPAQRIDDAHFMREMMPSRVFKEPRNWASSP